MATAYAPRSGMAVGFNDPIQSARIGSGAYSVDIDFAQIKALFNDGLGMKAADALVLNQLLGNSQVRAVAVQVVRPLELANASGVKQAYANTVFTPTRFTGGTSAGTLGAAATISPANNFKGFTTFGNAAAPAFINDVDAAGEKIANDLRLVGTTIAADNYVVSGKLAITVYGDFAHTAEELVNKFDPSFGGAVTTGSSIPPGGSAN